MSKYRCPRCGATHKEYQPMCRLCGQTMSEDAMPSAEPQARQVSSQKGSIKGVMFIGLGFVLVIILGAVALGFVQSNKVLDTAKDAIPGLAPNTGDGWSTVTDDEGKFHVDLPGSRTQEKKENGSAWVTKVSKETVISVGYETVTAPTTGTTSAREFLLTYADQKAAAGGASVDKRDDRSAFGLPTLYVEANGLVKDNPAAIKDGFPPNERVHYRMLFLLKGDRVYIIEVSSLYKNMTEFDRVVGSFGFTG